MKDAEETERVHDLLLKEHLEEEREWLDELQDWFEVRGLRVTQREEEQGPDCPLAMGAEHQSELSIPSHTGKKPNEVEEGFNDWGGRGCDDFVPGEVTKTAPSGDRTT